MLKTNLQTDDQTEFKRAGGQAGRKVGRQVDRQFSFSYVRHTASSFHFTNLCGDDSKMTNLQGGDLIYEMTILCGIYSEISSFNPI